MISRDRFTSESARSRFLGVAALVLAQLYCVQQGEAHTTSKKPGGYVAKSHVKMFSWISASVFGSRSRDVTDHPLWLKTAPMDPDPEKSSRSFMLTYKAEKTRMLITMPCGQTNLLASAFFPSQPAVPAHEVS